MRKPFVLSVAVAAGLLAFPTITPARLLENWPYDRLFKEADLVVFADAAKTEAATDKPPDQGWPYEFVAQNTKFKVCHVLKGKAPGPDIDVLHFKFGDVLKKGLDPKNIEDRMIMDGPLLVTFLSKPVTVKRNGKRDVVVPPEYLLFLRKLKDGRYEPVSGRIDPAL